MHGRNSVMTTFVSNTWRPEQPEQSMGRKGLRQTSLRGPAIRTANPPGRSGGLLPRDRTLLIQYYAIAGLGTRDEAHPHDGKAGELHFSFAAEHLILFPPTRNLAYPSDRCTPQRGAGSKCFFVERGDACLDPCWFHRALWRGSMRSCGRYCLRPSSSCDAGLGASRSPPQTAPGGSPCTRCLTR